MAWNPPARENRSCLLKRYAGRGVLMGLLLGMPVHAQAQVDPADRLPVELHERLVPRVTPVAGEDLVVRSPFTNAVPVGRGFELALFDIWQAGGGVVLDVDEPGLTVHFYAEGIEAMTLTDKVWEGLPRRAKSLQDLVDHTIGQARASRQPVGHLIITGHAGLPGCSALGGTMDDCTFRGLLTTYQRQQLARLRPYLGADAAIELRQCVTGSGIEGQRLLTAIYDITGAATSSYLSDFHFGDSAAHPRVRVGAKGLEMIEPGE